MGTDSPRSRDRQHHAGEGDPGAEETADKVAAKAQEYRELFELPSTEAVHTWPPSSGVVRFFGEQKPEEEHKKFFVLQKPQEEQIKQFYTLQTPEEEQVKLLQEPEEEALYDTFNCALKKKILLQGKLFVFDNYVGFYTNLFGYEKKVSIPFKDITSVKDAKTANVIPNAIRINAKEKNEKDKDKEYIFTSFLSRDDALKCIVTNWEATKGLGPRPENPKAPGVVPAGKAGKVVPVEDEPAEDDMDINLDPELDVDFEFEDEEKPPDEEKPRIKKPRTERRKDVFAYSKLSNAAEEAARAAAQRAEQEALAKAQEDESKRLLEEKEKNDKSWWFSVAAGSTSAAAVATVLCILVLL